MQEGQNIPLNSQTFHLTLQPFLFKPEKMSFMINRPLFEIVDQTDKTSQNQLLTTF